MYLEAEADVHENVKTLYERYGSETTTSTIIDPRSGGLPLAEGRPVIDEVFPAQHRLGTRVRVPHHSNHVITKFERGDRYRDVPRLCVQSFRRRARRSRATTMTSTSSK